MSRLVLAMLSDSEDKLESFHELDMGWVNEFNKQFEQQEVPFAEEIYKTELVEMMSVSVLNNLVTTTNDSEFIVDKTPLQNIIRKLFGYTIENQEKLL